MTCIKSTRDSGYLLGCSRLLVAEHGMKWERYLLAYFEAFCGIRPVNNRIMRSRIIGRRGGWKLGRY